MKRRILIWYHRRRAAYHDAMRCHTRSIFHRCYQWHEVWAKWHSIQVEILLHEDH